MQEGTSKPDLCRCCYHYTIISSKEVIILICRSVWQEEETAVGSPDLWLVGFQQQEQGWREDHAQTPTTRLGAIQPQSTFTSLYLATLQHFT